MQEEKDKIASSPLESGYSQNQLVSDLQLRTARLESELSHSMELRRVAERRFNDLVTETEPLRRREALMQGEIASVKNLLQQTEKDVHTYRSKYIEVTKGLQQVNIEQMGGTLAHTTLVSMSQLSHALTFGFNTSRLKTLTSLMNLSTLQNR